MTEFYRRLGLKILWAEYNNSVNRLTAAFDKKIKDKKSMVKDARETLSKFTYSKMRKCFNPHSPFLLEKEFFSDIIACNAAVITRILCLAGKADEAMEQLKDFYRQAYMAGFTRDRSFVLNRLDSRTFMPLRRSITRRYLEEIGFNHLDRILLCTGDCQTMQTAERIRYRLDLKGMDVLAYQHRLGSLAESGLAGCFQPVAYFFFVNAAADYALLPDTTRRSMLDSMQYIVDWLHTTRVKKSIFVTHVYFGVDNVVRFKRVKRSTAIDAVTRYSDDVAAILSRAPNAHLIDFRDIAPLSHGTEAFRDAPDYPVPLHIRFDIMDCVSERIAEALAGL